MDETFPSVTAVCGYRHDLVICLPLFSLSNKIDIYHLSVTAYRRGSRYNNHEQADRIRSVMTGFLLPLPLKD